MSKQTFSSFKELLVKKDLPGEEERKVDNRILGDIFQFIAPEFFREAIRHFKESDRKVLMDCYSNEALRSSGSLPRGAAEALVREGLRGLDDKVKISLMDLLEEDARKAAKEARRMQALANKYQPKDPAEEMKELDIRIASLDKEIQDIEMDLMVYEREGMEKSRRFANASDARERRRILKIKLLKRKKELTQKTSGKK